MEITFHPLTLEALDANRAEALCLFIAEEERPLSGLAGLADWRLAGRLSGMIRSGLLTGSAGEALLTPPGPRLAFEKLFLFGTGGTRSGFDPAARIVEALEKLSRAGVREAALQLPSGAAGEACVRALLEDEQAPARGLAFTADPARLVEALSESGAARPPDRRVVKVQQAARAATAAKPAPSSDPGARAGPQRYVPPPPRPSKKGR